MAFFFQDTMKIKFDLSALNPFKKPLAIQLIGIQLEEYERGVVQQEDAAAYHTKMAQYYREGVVRLRGQQAPAQ